MRHTLFKMQVCIFHGVTLYAKRPKVTILKPTDINAQKQRQQNAYTWFDSEAGRRLIQLEQPLLTRLSEGLFGYYLVQVQNFGHSFHVFDESPIQHRIQINLPGNAGLDTSVAACSEALPLATAAIDAVILPHTLDFAANPYLALKEVERILIPEGHVIILGFNALSLWGLWRWILQYRGKAPWTGHFLSYRRLSNWLGELGFDIESSAVCAFAPPGLNTTRSTRLDWLENWGQRNMSGFNGVYALRAVKRVSTVKRIKMRRQPTVRTTDARAPALGKFHVR